MEYYSARTHAHAHTATQLFGSSADTHSTSPGRLLLVSTNHHNNIGCNTYNTLLSNVAPMNYTTNVKMSLQNHIQCE